MSYAFYLECPSGEASSEGYLVLDDGQIELALLKIAFRTVLGDASILRMALTHAWGKGRKREVVPKQTAGSLSIGGSGPPLLSMTNGSIVSDF